MTFLELKKEKTLIRRFYDRYIVLLVIFFNIASIIACAITKNHKEPFLAVVPISYALLFFFMLFPAGEPDQKEISRRAQFGIIRHIFSVILVVLTLLSFLANLAMTFVLAMFGLTSEIFH
jgi:hypothetical protein